MDSFQSTLVDYGLGNLGYRGPKFTWSNKRDSFDFIKERLDRALATGGWCARFSKVSVEVLAARSSDHCPLWIRFKPSVLTSRGANPFWYKAF
jgi:exonuclease III